MYKLGVLSTIIVVVLFLAMKGVFIGTVILILNIAFFAAKLGGLFDKGHHQHGWSAGQSQGYAQKDVHLHIHNGGNNKLVPYSAAPVWEPTSQGWSSYGPPHHENGRHLRNPDDVHVSSTDKVGTAEPFEIIYPSESNTKNIIEPYNYIKHYRVKKT